ncbi:MgtC/SapB family protein [[Acidovorax] ebreus]|jgi:putative Mg2+ transporter-C (MgtC) family protein|uniref:Protein MgtC n=1 Tax=Acidovorax ebreus (strain TPSY) TaxID=535289 RepID=A0A9J9Q958_ACIET|nr:MgtC/SapB family protein [[Acidovorax] ebreus]ACM34939.1 MgtC/SapB transporter [[Acidovorax] ebreus TPSY]GAO21037.1 mgtc/sapb transporter [Alicycliphilus sp. B1]GAO22407.1 mgtc/sapb transporter [Alicycliphilus sp. B1]
MNAIHFSSLGALAVTFVNLAAAFILGALIGIERQVRQRTAGLRTNTLVSVGAAIFVSLGARLFEINGGSQTTITVVAYVVSGIGFLGAGAIMKEGASISGLNTAATLWGSGAVGACAGAGLLGEAGLAALFVLASNTLLRPVANRINRSPFREETSEATYMVFVICSREFQSDVREKVAEILDESSYPARQIDDHPFGEGEVEIEFTLYATAVQVDELNEAVKMAEALPGVRQAFWNAGDES